MRLVQMGLVLRGVVQMTPDPSLQMGVVQMGLVQMTLVQMGVDPLNEVVHISTREQNEIKIT